VVRKRPSLRVIDLFSGAGGLSLGFAQSRGADFVPVWANDTNADAANTYNANFGAHCVTANLVDLLEDPAFAVPAADVVVGGPPCQGFSLLNKQRRGDTRKQLWRPYLEVVRRSGAHTFVMENVPQLLRSDEYVEIAAAAEELGFSVWSDKLCAADHGVPQRRWRAFIVGSRLGDPADVFPPPRTHRAPGDDRSDPRWYVRSPAPWNTVRDALADLPPPKGTQIRDERPPLDLHFGRNPTAKSKARYRAIPDEGMNRFDLQRRALEITPACWIRKKSGGTDLFGRLWWDRPAFTIRTEFFKPEKGRYLHPEQHRPITHREAARLQSFPDSFLFTGESALTTRRTLGSPGQSPRRDVTASHTREAAASASSCSHTCTTSQPRSRSISSVSRSRSRVRSIFCRHQSALAFGHVACSGHPCQKQP